MRSVGRRYDTVTFLSDYGLEDEFVGVVKSVIRDLARHVTVIDLTHGIAPHDVRAGALTLARSVQYLASGIVLAVVDPGVGTGRRAVAIEVAGGETVPATRPSIESPAGWRWCKRAARVEQQQDGIPFAR